MKKTVKVTLILLGIILLGIVLTGTYVKVGLPDVGAAPDITIERTQERIERGKYLAHNVTVCMDCHSTRDWSQFAGPISGDNIGGGGERFDKNMGFPGTFFAKNITPYALGSWTDGELLRAITSGVNKDGKALFPVMPYHHYGKMDKEDIYSIIAYIRTLPAVRKDIPASEPDFPFNFIINTLPEKASYSERPFEGDIIKQGAYLVNASGCVDCHSKNEKGSIVPGSEFGGGMAFAQPAGTVTSTNISPDRETGIGNWTKEAFVQRFKMYNDTAYHPARLTSADINSPMPWTMYAGMKVSDLEAIYAYLQSIKPVKNEVVRYRKNNAVAQR
jgi:mono/diheme cytochrome c family protein